MQKIDTLRELPAPLVLLVSVEWVFCSWQKRKVNPASRETKLLQTEVFQGETAFCILKFKVFRIKDFHSKMIPEIIQILIYFLPLLIFP